MLMIGFLVECRCSCSLMPCIFLVVFNSDYWLITFSFVWNILTFQFLFKEIFAFIRSYVVPEGFPDSVTPSYVPYMTWRALKVGGFICFTIVIFFWFLHAFEVFIMVYVSAAFFWGSDGCFYYTDTSNFCWSIEKQCHFWSCCY